MLTDRERLRAWLLARRVIDVDSLIDARYPLEEGLAAFEAAGQKGALKVLLDIA